MPSASQSLPDQLAIFIQALEDLQAIARDAAIERRSLQQCFLGAQQYYQQTLLPALVASPVAASLTPYHTEVNRGLRLLGVDVAFLQQAKSPLTQQKRQAQMQQRLQALLELSQGLGAQL